MSVGMKYAIWLYRGAPCEGQDAPHIAANGGRYEVAKGMLLNGAGL